MSDAIASAIPFARELGINITKSDKDCIEATVIVRPALCTTGNIMHGGAIMAVADTLGAVGAFLNLPDGAGGTTTIESKTNFLGAAPEGSTVTCTATPVHVGQRTSVWQTTLKREDGKMVALVTQSQMVL